MIREVLKTLIGPFILLLCFGLTGIAATPLRASSDDLCETPLPPVSEGPGSLKDSFVNVGTLRVHYVEGGAGQTVVLIHGNAGGVEDFEFGTINDLTRRYRVIAIDRP